MNLKIRAFIAVSLATGAILCAPAWAGLETKGYFCSNCVDSESARQQAIQYAAPLVCNSTEVLSDPSVELVCRSEERRIVLGNYLTRQVFAFRVVRAESMPWETQADRVSLTNDEMTGYTLIFEFREDWEAAVLEGHTMSTDTTVQNGSVECSQGTALDWIIEPGGIAALKNRLFTEPCG